MHFNERSAHPHLCDWHVISPPSFSQYFPTVLSLPPTLSPQPFSEQCFFLSFLLPMTSTQALYILRTKPVITLVDRWWRINKSTERHCGFLKDLITKTLLLTSLYSCCDSDHRSQCAPPSAFTPAADIPPFSFSLDITFFLWEKDTSPLKSCPLAGRIVSYIFSPLWMSSCIIEDF